ncbi:LysR family transcriptional regulator ArgP [Dongshaea marina]|uniref:LysR family transcriptional regulator ArgP n=1 Tax=Dongshaea marina TaxID=2047966 RepID=UPI000D3E8065|nr:LysR family transcriptional regulator ArgP [Dongshaea marina]
MRGLDYRWLTALDAVIAKGSFEEAACELSLTQSAISQRIKQLEKWLSQPVLIRSQPPRATRVGEKLLGLYRRVHLLEQELLPELSADDAEFTSLSIAVNADSLATWLVPALSPLLNEYALALDLLVEDESRTLERLRRGEVVGAVSLKESPLPGCSVERLGEMEYLCVAAPEFANHFFSKGKSEQMFLSAPIVVFDYVDDLHQGFLQEMGWGQHQGICHHARSSEAFVKLAEQGSCYCFIPRLQAEKLLADGRLINLLPGQSIRRKLYWHHWTLAGGMVGRITRILCDYCKTGLY